MIRRRRHPLFRCVALATLAAFLSACATTRLPPISAAGGGFQPEPDEIELWGDARDEEATLLEKVDVYEDEELDEYLAAIVERLNPPGMAANPELEYRVRVIEDPSLNAFAYPHGSLYVHTGLLARVENEDQLATVLAHEMTHVENRHMLRFRRGVQNREIALGAVAIAASIWAATESWDEVGHGHWGKAAAIDLFSDLLIGLGLELAMLAAVNGYGRDLENEADQGGFAKLGAAGYDLSQAPRVYEILQDDHGDESRLEVFFFGSHPNLASRVQSAKLWLGQHPGSPAEGKIAEGQAFARKMRPVLRADARLNIEAGRLNIAEDELRRAAAAGPPDAEVLYLKARLHLAQAEEGPEKRPGLLAQARRELDQAVELDAKRAEYWGELGHLAYQEKDYRRACRAFETYLELDSDAEDAVEVQNLVKDLRSGEERCP
jgi:predicted Zn-dependent protease